MTSFHCYGRGTTINRDRLLFFPNGGRGLDRYAQKDLFTIGYPSRNASGIVRPCPDPLLSRIEVDWIIVLAPAKSNRCETIPDFKSPDGPDRHQCFRQVGLQLVEDRLTKPGRWVFKYTRTVRCDEFLGSRPDYLGTLAEDEIEALVAAWEMQP